MATPRGAERLIAALQAAGASVALAESCTGGEASAALTAVPGASGCVWGGAVVYGAAAKSALAGIPAELLRRFGLVSAETTVALAEGIRQRAAATLGLAVTGWAGPTGDGPDPVGTVYLAAATAGGTSVQRHQLPGTREQVRTAAVDLLIALALAALARAAGADDEVGQEAR